MDINQLEVLVAVAQKQSFSRAAEALHRTQPAVSQAIRRLELELGEALFDRSSKDGTLTAAGHVLYDFAQQMLNLRHGAHAAIKELKDLHRGKLTLSANEYTVMCLLPLIPIFGVAWGALFLGETVSLVMLGGAGLVLLGTFFVLRK